jgi:hypothetical protein
MGKKANTNTKVATQQPADAEEMPWYGKMVNHLMTPGSSLTTGVWNIFNGLIVGLYLIWLMFLVNFPDSVHTWVFFVLLTGLAITTNWFLKEIFAAGEDFESRKQRGEIDESGAKKDGADAAAPKAVEEAAKPEAKKSRRSAARKEE